MKKHKIHPHDILSAKVVQNKWGTFWFKDADGTTICRWLAYTRKST